MVGNYAPIEYLTRLAWLTSEAFQIIAKIVAAKSYLKEVQKVRSFELPNVQMLKDRALVAQILQEVTFLQEERSWCERFQLYVVRKRFDWPVKIRKFSLVDADKIERWAIKLVEFFP